jgi:hypothetical protein
MNRPEDSNGAGRESTYRESSARPAGRRWWPVVTPVVVLAVAASLLFPAARHQWALSIIRQPTHYTALSLNDAWTLPSTASRDSQIPISFTIANHEGRDVDYRYVLRAVDSAGTARRLGSASQMVTSGGNWTVWTSVRARCDVSPCRIVVLLPGHKERLDFFVGIKISPPKPRRRSRLHSAHHHHSLTK